MSCFHDDLEWDDALIESGIDLMVRDVISKVDRCNHISAYYYINIYIFVRVLCFHHVRFP